MPQISPSRHRAIVPALTCLLLAISAVLMPASSAGADYSESSSTRWFPQGKAVYAIATTPNVIYVGGAFSALRNSHSGRTENVSNIAAFDRDTGSPLEGWDVGTNGTVRSLLVSADGSRLFVGGDFTRLGGDVHNGLGVINLRTKAADPSWHTSVSSFGNPGQVRDMVRANGRLYLAGTFSAVGGVRRIGLAALAIDSGDVVESWRADADEGRPFALAVSRDGTNLVAGGTFKQLDGVARKFLGSVSLARGAHTGWTPSPVCGGCGVVDVAAAGKSVFVGARGPGGHVAGYNATTGGLRWSTRADGDVQAVSVSGGRVYAGGHFQPWFGGKRRTQIAVVRAGDGSVTPLAIPLTAPTRGGVHAIAVRNDGLYLGGAFTLNNNNNRGRYAKFPPA